MRGLIERRLPFLKDQPLFPLVILFALNAVDELDRIAFFTLAPEIRDHFGLSATGFGLIAGFSQVLILVGGLPLGFIGDRFKRTRLVLGAAALWATMSLLMGVAWALWVVVVARIGSGLGRVSNETVHTSLLTDYYPQGIQARVFGVHRSANTIGSIFGPILAGIIAAQLGDWRWAFILVVIPTVITVAFALRLREPLRGETEDSALAAEAGREEPIPLARGWRWLFSVPSLKRLYVSAFFGGGAIFALLAFIAQYFNDVFGIEETGRGLIGGGNGVAQLVGIIIGAIVADRLRSRTLGKMAAVAAAAVSIIGVGVLIIGAAPVVWIAIGGSWLANFGIGVWLAPNTAVLAIVLPARIRSLGIGTGVMFFGVGAFVFTIVAGSIVDAAGTREAISTLAPLLFLASAIYLAATRFVHADAERALQALATEVELRYERLNAGQQALLVCRGLDVAYDGVQVLFGVDFEVKEGEIVALLGTNGAGKSTLLRAISGVVHPVGGAVFFQGDNITFYEPHETAATGIIQVPGGRGIFPSLTIKENLETATWLIRSDSGYTKSAIDDVLSIFPILRERWEQRAGDLSGGEQQMLTLAQAFIARPKVLMIDELTLGLAPKLVEQLLQAVKAFHARGTTIILVEQSVNIALTVAQRAYFMEKGEVRFSGPAEDLLGRTDLIRSVFLEGAARSVGSGGERPEPVEAGDGRKASVVVGEVRSDGAPSPQGPPALEAMELTKSFGGILAVDSVNFTLQQGQILGIIGPNGAGKTTLFDLFSGFLKKDRGRILFFGEDIGEISAQARSKKGLGRSFQDARLFPSLTLAENLAIALDRHLEVKEPVAAALGLPSVRASESVAARRVDELIDLMGLGAFRDKFISELSTGSRRIVDITCALAHGPKVLILDEPSSGIAQAETESLGPLL
ncbi:MAG: MFS transporter, partial [Actinomycetota bacterium]